MLEYLVLIALTIKGEHASNLNPYNFKTEKLTSNEVSKNFF